MLGLVKTDRLYKGLMTAVDKEYFENVKIVQRGGYSIIVFDYTDETYYNNWITRTGVTPFSGKDNRIDSAISAEIGPMARRLSDAFTFIQALLLMNAAVYNALDGTTQAGVTTKEKQALDNFLAYRANNPELFTIDLASSITSALTGIVVTEKKIKNIVKEINQEPDTD